MFCPEPIKMFHEYKHIYCEHTKIIETPVNCFAYECENIGNKMLAMDKKEVKEWNSPGLTLRENDPRDDNS